MTKPNLTPPCRNCGKPFRKEWKRAVYCGPMCAILSRVIPDPVTGCWLWHGSKKSNGYGTLAMNARHFHVHRLMLTLKLGRDLDRDEDTRHTCDNRLCCNPAHLLPGSRTDNMRDAASRGRIVAVPPRNVGSKHGQSKLTEDAVREIRSSDLGAKELAARFGVRPEAVRKVLRRERWQHV